MATYTVFNAAPAGYSQGTMFAAGATLASAIGTELLYINPDGSRVVIRGSGFVFSGSVALGGLIDSVEHFNSSGTTLFSSYTSAGVPMLDLYSRWFGPSSFPELALTAGADLMQGSANADSFNAAGGNDTINGNDGDDYIDPGNGADIINGGNGFDMVSYAAANGDVTITKGITVNLALTTFLDPWGNTETISSIENIRGTRFADTLIGNASSNRFEGLAGADTFVGGDGFDILNYWQDARYGGTKAVTVNFATGTATDGFGDQDSFTGIEAAGGTDQADLFIGGDKALSNASYQAYGYGGDDTIKAGSFQFYTEPGAGNDTITGGAGANAEVSYQEYVGTKGAIMNLATGIVNDPYGGTDTITGGIEGLRGTRNADTLIGNAGNNSLRGLAGNDTLDGGDGIDIARYNRDAINGGTKGVVVDLGTGTATDGFGNTDTLISIESAGGTDSADTLTGGDALLPFNNRYSLHGNDGDDTLKARSQGVYFEPGAGNDTITGSPQNDLLSYADYTGAAGLVLDLGLGKVSDPFGGIDTFTSIESLRGTPNADTLTGDGQDNQFQGLGGADVIIGGAGIDEVRYDVDASYGGTNSVMVDLQAGKGTDGFGTIDTLLNIENVVGTDFADTLVGDGGANVLTGGLGNDTINGNDGEDTIDPGNGADIINGGNGFDMVSYAAANGDVTITKGITVNLALTTFLDPWGNTETISSIENIRGTRFADTLIGSTSQNRFEGLAGADTFVGGDGFDTLNYWQDARYGGTKAVTVNFATGTATDGFGDQDSFTGIKGAGGTDQADLFIGGDKALSNASYEAYGYGGDDTIKAGNISMYVEPGAGNDTITGGAGLNDEVSYREYVGTNGAIMNLATGIVNDPYGGTDTITGGIEGLRGTLNADTLIGNAGNNFLRGLAGNDTIDGGGGQDIVRYDRDAARGGTKGVVADLGTGTATDGFGDTDTLISIERLAGTNSADTLTGGDALLLFNNRYSLFGLGGDDTLKAGIQPVYFEPGAGNDTIIGTDVFGSQRFDAISYADYTGTVGVVINLGLSSVADPFGGIDTFSSIEGAYGTLNADTLVGNDQDNQLSGLAGADTITGGAGIDEVRYDSDASYGGSNSVMVDLQAGTGTDGFGTGFVDKLSGIEGIRGTNSLEWRSVSVDGKSPNHTDLLYGDGGDNFFRGLRGNDLIDGRGGSDTADYSRDAGQGGLAGAVVSLESQTGTDGFGTIDTLLNIENVVGTDFADTLVGDGGANVLTGGLGDDLLEGNGGIDTAVFSGASASYTVTAGPAGALIVSGADGKDTLRDIEVLKFSDATIDLGGSTSFGIAAITPSLAEGTGSGTTDFTFKVTRSGGTALAQTVGWSVAGAPGTLPAGSQPASAADFGAALPSGTVGFLAGETEKTITVPVLRDALVESNRVFVVTLAVPSGTTAVDGGVASAVILDDDAAYSATGGGALAEGTGGTRSFTFTVHRVGDLNGAGTVAFAVKGSGASPANGADFVGGVLPSGTVSFAAGQASRTVTVSVVGDSTQEANEGFEFVLANPTGGVIANHAVPTATILNDDTVFSIAATSANKPEGTGGSTAFTFTVTRTGTPGVFQSVEYSVAGITGTGTAPADAADFVNAGSGLFGGALFFSAGETSRTISVMVAADSVVELNERFAVTLTNPTGGATLGTASAQGIILNDDTSLRVVAGGPMVQPEGNAGLRPYSFVVQRQGYLSGTSTVKFTVAGSGAAPATASDFAGGVMPSGTVTFLANETSKTVTVNVAGDTVQEADEGFQLVLSGATGASITGASLGATIQSDDSTLSIAATSASKPEGNGPAGATTPFTFTVTRTGATSLAQGVSFAVAGASGNGTAPATAPDFANGVFPTGTVSFAAGQTTRTITINVRADQAQELNERFAVTLANPTGGAQIGIGTAQGIIFNDDFVSTAANQTLTGTTGPDLFLLGGGLDTVTGNGGLDSFRFLPAAIGNGATNATTIQDFNPGIGEKLDLSAIDAIAGTPADDAFTFNPIAGAGFSGAGSLVWALDGTRVSILGDTNGDFTADLTIFVRPVGTPDASWFIL